MSCKVVNNIRIFSAPKPARYDSFSGLVPCLVTKVFKDKDTGMLTARFRVTKTVRAYEKGYVGETAAQNMIPKGFVGKTSLGNLFIKSGYGWQESGEK